MGLLSFLFIEAIIVILYIAVIILVTISLSEVNADKQDETPEDKEHYDKARTYLGWAVGIGWALIIIAIIAIILAIIAAVFFSPEEAAAALFAEGGALSAEALSGYAAKYGKQFVTKAIQLKAASGEAKSGFLGFNSAFGLKGFLGFLEIFLLLISLVGIFIFGLLAALAASEIGQTTTRKGFSQAVWAAILGIVPLGIYILWWFINLIYTNSKKKKAHELEAELGVGTAAVAATSVHARRPPPAQPRRPAPQAQRAPPSTATAATQSRLSQAQDIVMAGYNSLSEEQKAQLRDAGLRALGAAIQKATS